MRTSNPIAAALGRAAVAVGPYALLLGLAIAAPVAGALAAAPTEPAFAPSDAETGERLYTQHCSGCHDAGGDGRAPPKAELSARSPNELLNTLTSGAMKTAATGMAPSDLRAVIVHLTGKAPIQATPAADTPPETNTCEHSPPVRRAEDDWNGWGRDLEESRFQPDPGLTPEGVARLKVKWAFVYPGARNSQPTVVGGRVYFGGYGGLVYSVNARMGCVEWRHDLDAGVRTAIVITPDQPEGPSRLLAVFGDTHGVVHALDAGTGKEVWATQVETHPRAVITGSPIAYKGRVYVPVSSLEEAIASDASYTCCTFRGSVAALNLSNGRLVWKTYAITQAPHPTKMAAGGHQLYGPAGAAIWSAPTIDEKRGVLYVATGDSYTDAPTDGDDAVIAMELSTGKVRWQRQMTKNDNFLIGCGRTPKPLNCPDTVGQDYDFGASPILGSLTDGRQVLLVGQKSGMVYGLDPDRRGATVWQTRIGAGGALGGVQWGMATDGVSLYAAVSDVAAGAAGKPGLYALNPATGKLIWSTPAPIAACAWGVKRCSPAQSAAVTVMPGLVFSGAMDGRLRAYSTNDGKILWEFDTAAAPYSPVNGGPPARGGVIDAGGATIARGMLFVHSGYGETNGGSNVLLALSVDGR
jgi:polyvinyl alcohol dehydrogenase (cytochrome)